MQEKMPQEKENPIEVVKQKNRKCLWNRKLVSVTWAEGQGAGRKKSGWLVDRRGSLQGPVALHEMLDFTLQAVSSYLKNSNQEFLHLPVQSFDEQEWSDGGDDRKGGKLKTKQKLMPHHHPTPTPSPALPHPFMGYMWHPSCTCGCP